MDTKGFRFPDDVILLSVRWCLRYQLSYRDLSEMLAERGASPVHTTIFRWVQRFTPVLVAAFGKMLPIVSIRVIPCASGPGRA